MALATAARDFGPDLLWEMLGPAGVATLSRRKPHLTKVTPGASSVQVRYARFEASRAELVLVLRPLATLGQSDAVSFVVKGWLEAGLERIVAIQQDGVDMNLREIVADEAKGEVRIITALERESRFVVKFS